MVRPADIELDKVNSPCGYGRVTRAREAARDGPQLVHPAVAVAIGEAGDPGQFLARWAAGAIEGTGGIARLGLELEQGLAGRDGRAAAELMERNRPFQGYGRTVTGRLPAKEFALLEAVDPRRLLRRRFDHDRERHPRLVPTFLRRPCPRRRGQDGRSENSSRSQSRHPTAPPSRVSGGKGIHAQTPTPAAGRARRAAGAKRGGTARRRAPGRNRAPAEASGLADGGR